MSIISKISKKKKNPYAKIVRLLEDDLPHSPEELQNRKGWQHTCARGHLSTAMLKVKDPILQCGHC
jgi:hypothetical protein